METDLTSVSEAEPEKTIVSDASELADCLSELADCLIDVEGVAESLGRRVSFAAVWEPKPGLIDPMKGKVMFIGKEAA